MALTNPVKVRERVLHYAGLDEPKSFDQGVAGAITGVFNKVLRGSDGSMYAAALHRRQVWGFLFTKDESIPMEFHSAGLSPTDWNALYRWMGASWKDETMRAEFKGELCWVYQWADAAFELLEGNPGITMAEIITILSNGNEEKKDEE